MYRQLTFPSLQLPRKKETTSCLPLFFLQVLDTSAVAKEPSLFLVSPFFPEYVSVQIMFPILENLNPAKPRTENHYWDFNLNIRDKRFEVLDSWRTPNDSVLDKNARLIAATVRSLWDHHYANSRVVLDDYPLVNIDVPRQDNE